VIKQTQLALSDGADWLGDWHPLAEQLGSAGGLVALRSASAGLRLPPVQSLKSLALFLRHYQERVLIPVELPAIRAAYLHTAGRELRELLALDRQLADEPLLETLASASQRVGQRQLRKLKPLRDLRLVRRYREAVEAGRAHGWHTLVYGLTLEVYSLPLRQGLLGYAQQTTRAFIHSAARSLKTSERECRALFEALCGPLPAAVDELLAERAAA
jgi:urease accessory protein UreF